MLKFLFLDTETRSRVDISEGTDRYTRAAECRIVTYAFETGPAKIWIPYKDPIPQDLLDALRDPAYLIIAHNASFDRLILERALGLKTPLSRWRCTMAGASAHGLPGSLEGLGAICGLSPDQAKLVDDKKLIDTFCCIQPALGRFIEPKEAPEEWERFCRYAIRDTEALREAFNRMPQHNYSGVNLRSWMLDQLINERGFGFDVQLAQAASRFLDQAREASRKKMKANTEEQVSSATQAKRLLAYIRNRYPDIDIESMRAGEVRDYLEQDDLDPILRTILEERLEAGKSAGTKFKRGLDLVGPQNRIRHWCRWSGAGRTGRHAARGYQPHNMARPAITVRRPPGHNRAGRIELEPVKASTIDDVIIPGIYSGAALDNPLVYGGPFEAVAIAVRHGIVAAQGNELVVADFKNIESVITAWLAGETLQLAAFQYSFDNPKDKSKDVYRILAGKMLGKPPELVNDSERQMGKVCILAFGFGGGVSALVNMSIAYQMDLEPLAAIVLPTATGDQLERADRAWQRAFLTGEDFELEREVYMACDVLKQAYRASNPAINQMRYYLNTAILEAVADRDGTVYHVARCKVWCNASFLVIELPSGRRLLYAAPLLKQEEIEDPLGGKAWKSRYITYLTVRGKSWRRERAWSGLFVENIVQAIANDVLRAAMLRVHDDTLTVPEIAAYLETLPPLERTAISLHVHDEIGLDVPKGSYSEARFLKVLKTKEPWMDGLPIAADIWINPRYGKR